jgi:hypothetical protein
VRPATVHAAAQLVRHTRGILTAIEKWAAATPPEMLHDEADEVIELLHGALTEVIELHEGGGLTNVIEQPLHAEIARVTGIVRSGLTTLNTRLGTPQPKAAPIPPGNTTRRERPAAP